MLRRDQPLAIYMEGNALGAPAKMGHGVVRYSPNPIVAVIDSTHEGRDMAELAGLPRAVPIVASVEAAADLGAQAMVLGIAPSGGQIPDSWRPAIETAIARGLSILNGLHEALAPQYPDLGDGQWIWDVRREPEGLQPSQGRAAALANRRLLMVGTDMGIGKMTAGLEIARVARESGIRTEFVATGQIGITVTGRGVPLDAIRLDFAGGAIEREVLRASEEADLVVVEGQGSLVHPGSSANLPLLRGSMPTHLILCHRAGQTSLTYLNDIKIPPLGHLIRLYEDLAEACGTFARPRTVGVALNTGHIRDDAEAQAACEAIEAELNLPCVDPIRHGPQRLVNALS